MRKLVLALVLVASGFLAHSMASPQWQTGAVTGYIALAIDDESTQMENIGTTYTQVTAFENADTAGEGVPFTVDAGNDTITVTQAGVYMILFQISFSGTAASTYECAPFVNTNTELAFSEFRRKLGATGDVGSASGLHVERLAANDTVMLKCHGDTVGDDMTPQMGQFVMIRIG